MSWWRIRDWISTAYYTIRNRSRVIEYISELRAEIKGNIWLIQDLQEILTNHDICPDCGKKPCELEEDQ